MAFEDGGVWQRELHALADGELQLACPSCEEHLLLGLGGPAFDLESFADGSLALSAVTAARPAPASAEARLLALARADGRNGVADTLPYLFGGGACPRCRQWIDIPQALA